MQLELTREEFASLKSLISTRRDARRPADHDRKFITKGLARLTARGNLKLTPRGEIRVLLGR